MDLTNKRIDNLGEGVNKRIDGLRNDISKNRAEIRELRAQMGTQFRWTLALIITMWVTVIAAVLFR